MDKILEAAVTITVVAALINLAYSIRSHFALKKLTTTFKSAKIDDQFLLEQIVHTRTSINVLYGLLPIVGFLIVYFGLDLQSSVTKAVTDKIEAASQIDLAVAKQKTEAIVAKDSVARHHLTSISRSASTAMELLERVQRAPQRLYVLKGLKVTNNKFVFPYAELRTVDGRSLPQDASTPVLMYFAYNDRHDELGGLYIKATSVGIEGPPDDYYLDLWLYY